MFSELEPPDVELLACLSEEAGEVSQAVGKILRHGYNSCHPVTGVSNRRSLTKEIGDVFAIAALLVAAGEIGEEEIEEAKRDKLRRISYYLHYKHVIPSPDGKGPKAASPSELTSPG